MVSSYINMENHQIQQEQSKKRYYMTISDQLTLSATLEP
jgi:hypothetical protein